MLRSLSVEAAPWQKAFKDNGSEIETAARDCIGTGFGVIASTSGFEADIKELISTRDG